MGETKIEWATTTWNPVTGCTKVSAGCKNCYAERMSKRLAGRFGYDADDPFKVTLHPDRLEEPLHWRKPRRVFVCSMGDLFHEDVPVEWIRELCFVMAHCPQHVFLFLTKRPQRMKDALDWVFNGPMPCRHIWLGVTAENQEQADARIPVLLQIPAAVRFVSVEPMLGVVDVDLWLSEFDHRPTYDYYRAAHPGMENKIIRTFHGIDWIICGAETGPGKREMELDWARSLRDQCQAAGVPFFFKKDSSGSRLLDGREWNEYPREV